MDHDYPITPGLHPRGFYVTTSVSRVYSIEHAIQHAGFTTNRIDDNPPDPDFIIARLTPQTQMIVFPTNEAAHLWLMLNTKD